MSSKNKRETEFLDILERNMGFIAKAASVYAYTSQDKKDLVNDIILELWQSYPKFRGDSKVSTWLYRVTLNISLKTKRSRDNGKIVFVDEINIFANTTIMDSEAEFIREQELRTIYECISKLNRINKAIILLYLEDKSNDEIADIVGISRTNVSTRLSRIREELKIIYEQIK
ncbi:RNA polymerase sigma factor [Dysgonomonas sp. ZJ709]|uniref:RNA polymerase sigma factor n=1 Tax=Dysgonomonas sp. ZJ709 TaxID=2709797 RepID=UPI0013EBBE4C|nr:sigma-70 family RNA polymerase sigma factor [Dysgonomonas sp. ZJ709]